MKELVHYLVEHRLVLLLLAAIVVVTVGYFATLQPREQEATAEIVVPAAVHILNEGSTTGEELEITGLIEAHDEQAGTLTIGGVDYSISGHAGELDDALEVGATVRLRAIEAQDGTSTILRVTSLSLVDSPDNTGPVADVLYSSSGYCEGGKPFVNLQAIFGGNEKWLKGDVNQGWSTQGDMQCNFVSYDELTFTALYNCTAPEDSEGIFVFTGSPPVAIHLGECGGAEIEGSAPPSREREPDCGDRKC